MPRPRKPIDEKYSAKITVSFLPETKRQIEILCSIDGITFNALMNELAENLCKLNSMTISLTICAAIKNLRR